jgi:tetratricopeptide (TPR) repeat protein/glycosyltransferase involved in cell wall biosynthesis
MNTLYKEKYVFYCNSILMDGDSYKHQGLGGSESALIYMAQELARANKQVVVFCRTETPGMYAGVYYEKLEKLAAFIQFTIIDVFISVRSPEIFQLPIKARVKALWIHDAADQPHLLPLHEAEIRDAIDCYITLSEWQTRGLLQTFKIPKEKIFISRNGVRRQFFKTYRSRRKKRLVYTSTPFRGLEILLKLFPEIRKEIHDVELYVYSSMEIYGISKKDDQDRFGHIYERCQQPGVTLVGSLPQKELARELMKAKVFVYPNIFDETSCIAALEAQAAGLPAVVSQKGALPETVIHGKSGFTVLDEKEFVARVVSLLKNDNEWSLMSAFARERVMEKFCWDVIATEWITFFDQSRPTVSLCMIVRNEEKNIAQCIESVQPLIDEIVVVDTGSTDLTKEIALKYGARVFDFEWKNDFAAARNFSLEKATSDWILVLDADEVMSLRDLPKLRELLNVSDAYRFFQRSYLNDPTIVGWKANTEDDAEGAGYAGFFDSPLTRLFRNNSKFRFEGSVHEVIEPAILREKKKIINTNIPIHHYGKVVTKDYLQKKGELYLEIGHAKINECPDNPRNYYDLGAQFFEMNRLREAKEAFKKALECDPNYYRALCDLGLVYAKEEKFEKSRKLLEKTIELNPHYTSAYINLGLVYEGLYETEKAIDSFRSALECDPHNTQAMKHLGMVYFSKQHYSDAYDMFKRLRKTGDIESVLVEYAHTCYEIGTLFMKKNDFVKTKKYFEEALKCNPSHVKAWNDLGVLYANHGHMSEAEGCFQKVIDESLLHSRSHSECVKAYINLGFVYNNKGEYKKAIDSLERALEIDPTNAEIYNHIGIAKCGLGLLADGVRFFEMALKVNPNHASARINLRRVNETLIKERNYQATVKEE